MPRTLRSLFMPLLTLGCALPREAQEPPPPAAGGIPRQLFELTRFPVEVIP